MMLFSALMPGVLPLAESNPMEHVLTRKLIAEPLFHLCGQPVYFTSHIVMMLLAALLMLLIFPFIGAQSRRSHVPTGMRNLFEAILSFLRTEVFQPALGPHTDRFVPLLWTTFFFILFCNLLGLIPLHDFIIVLNTKAGTHLPEIGGTATANINVTAALALMAFIVFHISGIWQQIRIQMNPALDPHQGHGAAAGHDHGHAAAVVHGKPFPLAVVAGFFLYWKNFVPPVPGWLWPMMFVLELIGALIKPFSLCMRLFANMVAGHLVLASLVSLIFLAEAYAVRGSLGLVVVAGCAVFSILELFVAFLQAYIFTFLTTLFIAAAVAPEH